MADKKAILGTTTLEWHSTEDIPPMHVEEYAEESWMQSEPLLLADAAGTMAVGYCQQPFDGKPEFDTVCVQKIGEICKWALLEKPPSRRNHDERPATKLPRGRPKDSSRPAWT